MAFNWQGYLQIARVLAQETQGVNQEAAWRSAVSRAYYAAFCHARNYARDRHNLILGNDPGDHKLVRKHFLKRKMYNVASDLQDLRIWRNDCDYSDVLTNLLALVNSAINKAQSVVSALP